MTQALFEAAADLIAQADGLIIAAGAGMGVDSGLPDFRGNQGFWRVYPALAEARIAFEEIACPDAFRDAPERAWGFYGHRLNLYRRTIPHAGFAVLKRWGLRLPRGAFVFTSNVDGQFQRAGFDSNQVCEVHGSIHHLQCVQGCDGRILSKDFPVKHRFPMTGRQAGFSFLLTCDSFLALHVRDGSDRQTASL